MSQAGADKRTTSCAELEIRPWLLQQVTAPAAAQHSNVQPALALALAHAHAKVHERILMHTRTYPTRAPHLQLQFNLAIDREPTRTRAEQVVGKNVCPSCGQAKNELNHNQSTMGGVCVRSVHLHRCAHWSAATHRHQHLAWLSPQVQLGYASQPFPLHPTEMSRAVFMQQAQEPGPRRLRCDEDRRLQRVCAHSNGM